MSSTDSVATPGTQLGTPTVSRHATPLYETSELIQNGSVARNVAVRDIERTVPGGCRMTTVPLITPRYQRKSRINRRMEVTDSFAECTTATEALRQQSTENLHVYNGPVAYTQEMHFHTYDVYKKGKNKIYTRSVGYSSDGDIVLLREDYSEPSDTGNQFTRRQTEISQPTVLNARARRPLTDTELNSDKKLPMNQPRFKKYPGVHAPKNRKVLNRLHNDYFANEMALKILEQTRQRREDGIDDTEPRRRPTFTDLPPAVVRAFDLKDEEQVRELERLGIRSTPPARFVQAPRHPDSTDARFSALNVRLRSELQHALNSDFLLQQIADLEACFTAFIKHGVTEESLLFRFHTGYGRLVCHGVAAFYQLVSKSHDVLDGTTKLTYVGFPKNKKKGLRSVNLPHGTLLHVLRYNMKNLPPKHSLSPVLTFQKDSMPPSDLIDPMSPLDLNGEPVPSHSGEGEVEDRTERMDPRGPVGDNDLAQYNNSTVLRTEQLEVPDVKVPVYVPLSWTVLTALMDESDYVATAPDAALTATQRKKMKRMGVRRYSPLSGDNGETVLL